MNQYRCFFGRFDKSGRPCDGLWDAAHLIPKQRIKQAGIDSYPDIWDRRIVRLSCRYHHHKADQGFIRLGFNDYPRSVMDWAHDHHFYWAGEREGWRASKQKPPRTYSVKAI